MEGVLKEGVEEVIGIRELETPEGVVMEGEGVWEGAASRVKWVCASEALRATSAWHARSE